MESKVNSFIDTYLYNSLLMDALLIIIIALANEFAPTLILVKSELSFQSDLIGSLISTSVSLAGFILAALTIIVTFKSNIASKHRASDEQKVSDPKNPLELLFSTDNYNLIVKVFKDSIIELTIIFITLYLISVNIGSVNSSCIYHINVYAIIVVSLSVFRSLFILFWVLELDRHQKTD